MINYEKFTKTANSAVNAAFNQAERLGHTYMGSEHLLIGILCEGTAKIILRTNGITLDKVVEKVSESVGKGNSTQLSPDSMTPTAKSILEAAYIASQTQGSALVGTEHILMAILRETKCSAFNILREMNASPSKLYSDCIGANGEAVSKAFQAEIKLPTLSKYGRDLNLAAVQKKCDPVIGREEEIERVLQILSRRTKNNPCLIGEAGVGKTAIVEGIAELLVSGNTPENMKDKRIFPLTFHQCSPEQNTAATLKSG